MREGGRDGRPPSQRTSGCDLHHVQAVELGLARLEPVDDVRVEVRAATAADLLRGGLPAHRCAIRALAGHRVERVDEGEDPRGQRDALLGEPVRVPVPVPPLVVGADDARAFLVEERDVGEERSPSSACSSILRRSAPVRRPGLRRIPSGMPIFPTSCRRKPHSRLGSSSSDGATSSVSLVAYDVTRRECRLVPKSRDSSADASTATVCA